MRLKAAHCFQEKDVPAKRSHEDLFVRLGRHNIDLPHEKGSTTREVREIVIHPDWKYYSVKWDADIAILLLDEPVRFSQMIQPSCLPEIGDTSEMAHGKVVKSFHS